MQRIVILGGGVGGTLTANLLVRKLKKEIDRGEAEVTIVDASGVHVYQPGFMYIAMGGERAEGLERPEASLLDKEVNLVIGKVVRVDEAASAVELEDGSRLHFDQLVLATGSRIAPEEIEHFELAQSVNQFWNRSGIDVAGEQLATAWIAGKNKTEPVNRVDIASFFTVNMMGSSIVSSS